ncbi:WD repeat containing antisense to TP53 [Echinococcus multilocularis]|uniref:WD repeat-containing protein 79 n=1 Tax=Echinococcus multilocularis TaxID=6211 RepID=A0A087W1D9_ECHMU|nr:WD repeat containing antisense to TP53 [Echinococcus multilocularis]
MVPVNEIPGSASLKAPESQSTTELVETFAVVTMATEENIKEPSPLVSSGTLDLGLKPGGADAPVNISNEPLVVTPSEAEEEPMDQNFEGHCEDYPVDWTFSQPKLFTTIDKEFSCDYHGVYLYNNYLRGCKWSPDGCCLLTLSFDNVFRLFDFPPALTNYGEKFSIDTDPLTTEIPVVLRMPECELVYDYCWFPYMRSDDPSTCCFVSTGRRMPVRLWDAYDGSQRATYLPSNHLGEFTSPQSVAFSTDGRLLYCGFRRYIQVFHVDRPGSRSERRPPLGQRSKQGGIFSALSAPVLNGVSGDSAESVYAVGTFGGTVAVYSESGGGEAVSPILQGPRRGVSQVQFVTPASGVVPWYLIAGGRSDGSIYVWDSRFLKSETPLATLSRRVENYQRFQFDVDPTGRYLFTGNQTGAVSCYDLLTMRLASVWRGHEDSCHSVSVHPFLPALATASGQKRPLLTPHLADDHLLTCTPSTPSKTPKFTSSSSSDSENELPLSLTDAEATAVVASGDRINFPMAGRLDLLPIRKEGSR